MKEPHPHRIRTALPDLEMESANVETYVNDLAASFETGLQFYTQWQRRRVKENHYRKSGSASHSSTSNSALATSFSIASRVKETFEVGYAIIGIDFAKGDSKSRYVLATQAGNMKGQVDILRNAMTLTPGPLEIGVILQVSETARLSSIQALADLYQRLAIGRPVPREIPVPKWRSSSRENILPDIVPPPPPPIPLDDDAITAWSTASGPPVFQSEPPSPPPTPKPPTPEELLLPPAGASTAGGPLGPGLGLGFDRPTNSVFSIFCPEAMALQVDVRRPVPEGRKCRCGFRWRAPELPAAAVGPGAGPRAGAILLKDGFAMTRRFLAKSHCEGRRGYGCVLCTSCGRTETYPTAEGLAMHVNTAHSKWQMLHDRDMA